MEGSVSLWMVWGWFLVQGPPGAVLEVRADKFAERTSTSSLFGPISGSTENPTHPTNPKPTTQVAPKAALPRTNTLPDLKVNVRTLCVCNLLVGRCDINCCCDPDCSSSDLSTFSTCDVHIVTGDNELCRQDAAMYSTNSSEVVTLINPSLFCIETNNYKKGSSFFAPEVPNTSNFNSLMKQFGGFSFSTDKAPPTLSPTSASSSTSSSYQYGMPIKVRGGYLKLPAPLVTATCTDNNPAAFLIDQTTHCSRRIQKSTNCTSLPAFSINNYLNVKILPSPNANLNSGIPVFLSSIILKSLNGTLIRLKDFAVNNWLPNQDVNMCRNIVLEVEYIIVYNSKGTIVNASAALVLGTIESSLVPVQQRFQIKFIQQKQIWAADSHEEFSQSRLSTDGRVPDAGTFWIQLKLWLHYARCGCEVPESLVLEVKWTKYGSLINPQAKIVAVTQTIRETCILRSLKTATNLYISTSVKFTDVSASAQPGYKSKPMLYINLPYDFFFPFV
ncbi:tectonic-1-like isoform X2 [Mobula hypostoma]|uniref:tectonic-1-like isoform X2 n=1 Tax=Mobula hypostoma TaxID=723540 RepID=UPI002FC2D392